MGKAFDFSLDGAPPDEFEAQSERLLAARCFRNVLPTAEGSLDHALAIRTNLLARFPKHLSRDFLEEIDVRLLARLLEQPKLWQTLEAIFQECAQSNNLSISAKVADLYEHADAKLAKKMEAALAGRWKAAGNPKLSHAEKVTAIRRGLLGEANRSKVSAAERLAQLRQLSDKALSAMKADEDKEEALMRDAIRLAHASTMASILALDAEEAERFDELVGKVPEVGPAKKDSPPVKKEAPKEPEEKGVIVVGAQAHVEQGSLTKKSDRDPKRGGYRQAYPVSMKAGNVYTIDLISTDFNSYLRLETSGGDALAADDDGGGYPHARITYAPKKDGTYRIIATTSDQKGEGRYTLTIQQTSAQGPVAFGVPRYYPRRIPPPWMIPPKPAPVQETPKPAPEDKHSTLPLSDLADLGSNKSSVRTAAFENLAGKSLDKLPPQHARKIARYLLETIATDEELAAVSGKLKAFANCPPVLQALEDVVADGKMTQERAEAVVGGVLGQRLRFARDEDWRLACRKLLLERCLESIPVPANDGDRVAEIFRELYKEQGLSFGLEDREFLDQTRPAKVLEGLIKHVAGRAAKREPAPADKEYLDQIDRHLRAARFVAEDDLAHVVLLQRIWIRVLSAHLEGRAPKKAKRMKEIQEDLGKQDALSRSAVEQLRAGEEKILRIWSLALESR